MAQTVFEDYARVLVLLHTAAAIVLIGSSSHHCLVALGYVRGSIRVRLGRTYAAIVAIAYVTTNALGAVAYPTFRYHVRGLYLDRHAVWASNLFDIKEHLAAMGLPLAMGCFILSRVMDPRQNQTMTLGYALLAFGVAAIAWFGVVSGLLVTLVKGV